VAIQGKAVNENRGALTNQSIGRAWAVVELLLAPTARLIPAWGAAPGKGKENNARAESPSYDLA
jgi:hypothetical protein